MKNRLKKFLVYIMTLSLILCTPAQQANAAGNVQTLLKNMGKSNSPLLEYDDPINYAGKYSESFLGKLDLFLVNWDVSSIMTSKNDKWNSSMEQVLLEILADDTLSRQYLKARPEKLIKAADKTVDTLIKMTNKTVLKKLKGVKELDNWATAALKDRLKLDFQKSQVKIEILALLKTNTEDINLKTACDNCINTVFTNVINKGKNTIVNGLVSVGVKKTIARSAVKNQILMTPFKEFSKNAFKVLGEAAKGVNYALVILDAKDLVTFVGGAESRSDAYMNIVSYQIVYNAALASYQRLVKKYKNNKDQAAIIEALFEIMLSAKQKSYEDLPNMLGKSDWNKALKENKSLKTNKNKIKKVTISNYKKGNSKQASIKLNQSTATLYINGSNKLQLKAEIKGSDAKVEWKSSNTEVATVNSRGKVHAKKVGTTTITAKANGKTAKCKVTVKKVSRSKDLRGRYFWDINVYSDDTLRFYEERKPYTDSVMEYRDENGVTKFYYTTDSTTFNNKSGELKFSCANISGYYSRYSQLQVECTWDIYGRLGLLIYIPDGEEIVMETFVETVPF